MSNSFSLLEVKEVQPFAPRKALEVFHLTVSLPSSVEEEFSLLGLPQKQAQKATTTGVHCSVFVMQERQVPLEQQDSNWMARMI
jgi:hypothetical protein